MVQTGNPTTLAALNAEILAQLPTAGAPPISANTLRQVLLDLTASLEISAAFDPWSPPPPAIAKANRTLIADYTFGTTATPLLGTATPITTLAQLNSLFWTSFNFASMPISGASGAGTAMSTRFSNESPWHIWSDTSTMTVETNDLLIQGQLNPAVTTDASLQKLQQYSSTAINVTGVGTFGPWTIPTGLDWQVGDAINIDSSGKTCQAEGTIASYNPATGALSINVTHVAIAGSSTGNILTRWPIKTGMIRTKTPYLYGFFEMMAWLPPGEGSCVQFWLYVDDQLANGGSANEIDILEQLINSNRSVDGTWTWSNFHISFGSTEPTGKIIYYDARTGGQFNVGDFTSGPLLIHHPNFDVTAGYHKFQCLWVPGYVAFYVDDVPSFVATMPWKQGQGINSSFAELICNYSIGIGGDGVATHGETFAGLPKNVAAFPGNLKVQYIRVWQSAAEIAVATNILSQQTFNLLLGGPGMTGGWLTGQGGSTATLTILQGSDPSGGASAARLTEGAGFTGHNAQQNVQIRGGSTYTFSAKIKIGSVGSRNIQLIFGDTTFTDMVIAYFNPSTGALVSSTPIGGATLIGTSPITPLTGGWFQVWVTGSLSPIYTSTTEAISLAVGTTTSYDPATNAPANSNVLLFDPHLILGTSP